MALGTIGDYNALAALQRGKSPAGGTGLSQSQAGIQAGFDNQIRMAQTLFGEGSQVYGEGGTPNSFDSSILNDTMMLEALTTITRLMRNEASLPQRGVSRQAPTQAVSSVTPSADSISSIVAPASLPEVGTLSAKFESGGAGVAAVGFDRVGGTSYGKYQIASKPGTMDRFLSFLDDKAPAWADRLRNAGPANTGSKEGSMPSEWKQIAQENPARFEKMQHDFIAKETYDPARSMILKQTGLDFDNAPPALREVLWSTSVQHGPTGAAKIFGKVIDQFVGNVDKSDFSSKLIEGVYDTRKGQFGSSTKRVQQAVANRFDTEKQLALNMLGQTGISRIV